jgi:hypothetical protein
METSQEREVEEIMVKWVRQAIIGCLKQHADLTRNDQVDNLRECLVNVTREIMIYAEEKVRNER